MSLLISVSFLWTILLTNHISWKEALHRLEDAALEYAQDNVFEQGVHLSQNPPLWPTTTVFSKRDREQPPFNQLACFRIPSLVRVNNHTLVAFAEARTPSCADCSTTAIVQKTSTDSGVSWNPIKYVVPPVDIGANPTSVYDKQKNRILLYYVRGMSYDPESNESICSPGATNWLIESYDDGRSWSNPINITESLGDYRGGLPGPGNAVQLDSGRIVIPIHYGTAERLWGNDVVMWTDDGLEYSMSETHFKGMDEASIVESNETLIMWMRNAHNTDCACKARSLSFDNGTSWSDPTFDPQLMDPICQGSASVSSTGQLVYVGPRFKYARSRLTLWYKSAEQIGAINDWKVVNITDASVYTDYSSVVADMYSQEYGHHFGVLWGNCAVPFPFRVWCMEDWGISYSHVQI